MRHSRLLFALCFLAITAAHADDWGMYLGDLSHTSFRPGETQITSGNVSQLQPLWKTSFGATVASGVTVSGGFLFFGDWDGNFHSVNALTGSAAWSQFLGQAPAPADPSCGPGLGVSAQPVVSADVVYAGGGDSAVYAMNAHTGEILWRVPLADPQTGAYLWSSLMLSNNALYVGIASLTDCPMVRGGLARIPLDDPTHPSIRYFMPPNQQGAGVWSTPAIDEKNGLVYVATGNADTQDAENGIWGSALLALDATTLDVRSYFFRPITPEEDDADWGSSPLLFESGGQPLIAANGKNGVMYVLTTPDLSLVWSYTLAIDCDSPEVGCGSISTPAFDGKTLVTGSGQPSADSSLQGAVYAFDPASQNLLWMYPATGTVLGPVTLTPGLVFVSSDAKLAALDIATGAELWNDGGHAGLYSQPVVSGGVLYATYINGDVIAWGLPSGSGGPPTLSPSQSGLQFLYTVGGPAPVAQTITISASTPLNFTVASDSPWLTTSPQSATTPSPVTVAVNASGMASGTYTGNLSFSAPGISPVSVQVTLVVNPVLPSMDGTSMVNAASFQAALAPGSLFAIFADSLSADTTTAVTAPWATAWDGISVKINGIAAPLAYVSPSQINAQVPYEVAPGTAQLTIESNGTATAPVSLTIQASAPGVFLGAGGRAAALNQDNTPNSPENPASTGNVISVYLTGQGAVDPAVDTGAAAPGVALSSTVATTTATIGDLPSTVEFSGLAPGFVGLAQVNLLVPDLPAGDYPVVVNIGGVASNAGTVSIAAQ